MKNIVILVSGSGTNLQRIIDCVQNGEIRESNIAMVIADRSCYALQRAQSHDIPTALILRGKNFSHDLQMSLPANTDLIVLAGFLSILSADFCENFKGKIINIHPALLPKFGGKGMWGHHVHEAVLLANEKQSGATVHYVTSGIDEGEIIWQKSFPVAENESVATLAEKIHAVEFEIFPKAIDLVLENINR